MTLRIQCEGQMTSKMATGQWRTQIYLIWTIVLLFISATAQETPRPRVLCDMFKASLCLRRAASMLNSQTEDGNRNIELICGRNRPIDNHISICRDFVSECPRTNKNARQVRRVAQGLHLSLKSYMVHFCESVELPGDLCGDLEKRTSDIKECWDNDPSNITCSSLQKIFYCFEDARGACNDVQIVDEENSLVYESVMTLKDKKCILTFQGDVFKTPPDGEHPVRHGHGRDHTRHQHTTTTLLPSSSTSVPESTTVPSLLLITEGEEEELEENKFNDDSKMVPEPSSSTTVEPTTLSTTEATATTITTSNILPPLPEENEYDRVEPPPCNDPIERIFKLQECSRHSNYRQGGVCRKIQRKLNCISHHVRRCKDDFVKENADIIVNSTRLTAAQFGCDVSYMGKPLVTNPHMINSWDDLRVPPSGRRRSTKAPVVTKPPVVIDPNYQSTTTYYYIYESEDGNDNGQFDHVYSDKNEEHTNDKPHDKPPDPHSEDHSVEITNEEINRDEAGDTYNYAPKRQNQNQNQNSDVDTEHNINHSKKDSDIKERNSNGDAIDSISNDEDNHSKEILLIENEEEDTNMLESRDRQEPIKSKPASSGAPSTKGVAVFTVIYLLWIYFLEIFH